jgi:hypothetical protein
MLDETKLQHLMDLIRVQTELRYVKEGYTNMVHAHEWEVKSVYGPKYTKVDVGSSGKYMIVNDTGEIYGIKAYGVIHRGHYYGTLDTVNDYNWGGYTAVKR